jgi:hypothetical protein
MGCRNGSGCTGKREPGRQKKWSLTVTRMPVIFTFNLEAISGSSTALNALAFHFRPSKKKKTACHRLPVPLCHDRTFLLMSYVRRPAVGRAGEFEGLIMALLSPTAGAARLRRVANR